MIAVLFVCFAGRHAAAQELKFSHKLHLEQAGATCGDCHSAAKDSQAATDRLLPSRQKCAVCHEGGAATPVDTAGLDMIASPPRSYRFNHQFHLQLGNVATLIAAAIDNGSYLGKAGDARKHLDTNDACQACHRGVEETGLATAAHLPRMSDCLVCHSKVDNPFSCEKCHLEGINLRPADHTREFVDLHPTGKLEFDKQTCLPCHGRNFGCMGCH
ncbi:MAG: cytochrome c3 family protein [Acidobacteria bacterium]|nr:cytochrome c3 family protein [Acidobacteriota bacterium]